MKLKFMDEQTLRSQVVEAAHGDAEIILASELARFAHEGQSRHALRPGTVVKDAYWMHPARCALRTQRWIEPGDTARIVFIIALLHDVLEDAPERVNAFFASWDSPIELIRSVWGDEIADALVLLCSTPDVDYNTYIARILENPIPLLVKASDLVDNGGSLKFTVSSQKRTSLARKYQGPLLQVSDAISTLDDPQIRVDDILARLHRVWQVLEPILAHDTLLDVLQRD